MRFPPGARVEVPGFTRQPEGADVIVGHPARAVFLRVPAAAAEVLDDLANGLTVGEAAELHHQRYAETADLEDFLSDLERRGFVRMASDASRIHAPPAGTPDAPVRPYHFEWLSPRLARIFFGPAPASAAAGLLVLAAAALASDPGLIPNWRALYFSENTARYLLTLMALGLLTTFFHEMGHLLAARAAGVSCRFGVSNQLWFVVWETDITGVWALPRRQRYLPIVAGPLVDLMSAAALVLLAWAEVHGGLSVPPTWSRTARGLLFLYLMRLAWQCYFFLRTDFYYAAVNALGCTNLMHDTRAYLWSTLRRSLGRRAEDALGHLAPRERSAVRIYSGLWLVGRTLAFALLVLVQFPLFVQYLGLVTRHLRGEVTPAPGAPSLVTAVAFIAFLVAGLTLWLRQIRPIQRMKRWLNQ
jgi:hypothetical protein